MVDQAAAEAALVVIGLTLEDVERMDRERKIRGKRDARGCLCGHTAGGHFPTQGEPYDDLM